MLVMAVAAILDRDLRTLAREVAAYPDEEALWRTPAGIANSAGTLVLHLTGNIEHFMGAKLGGSDFVRDRAREFSDRDVPRTALLGRIEAARAAVRAAAERTGDERQDEDYPEAVGGVRVALADLLVHLVSHLGYHLGQVDYHRRVVTGSARSVDAIRAAELATARPVAD
jgi:uncharacterized damage-inducible protein DinB